MNILLPEWAYLIAKIFIFLGCLGLVIGLLQKRLSLKVIILLGSIFFLSFVIVVHINRAFTQPQGRYLLPGIPALAVLLAMGFRHLCFQLKQLYLSIPILLVMANVAVLWLVIVPTYWPPVFNHVSAQPMSLQSEVTTGTAGAGTQEMLPIDGANSRWIFETSTEAALFPFLRFELAGLSNNQDVRGRVYFVMAGDTVVEQQSVPFDWKADGSKRLITVPMYQNPFWNGTVKRVYIDPLDSEALARSADAKVRIDNVYVTGHLR